MRLLLRKMSAYEVEMIARTPHAVSAHGACSRDDPAPKLSPTSRIWRPAMLGWSRMKGGSLSEPSSLNRQSRKSASARPALSVTLRIAGRHDLVGVDVLGRDRDHRLVNIVNGSATLSDRRSRASVSMPGEAARVGSPRR